MSQHGSLLCHAAPAAKRFRLTGKQSGPPQLSTFDGHWQVLSSSSGSAKRGDCLATISGLEMCWHNEDETVHALQRKSANELVYSVDGVCYTALLRDDGKLEWSDGDVWVRRAPHVSEEKRSLSMLVHNISSLGKSDTRDARAETWLVTTLASLQSAIPVRTWYSALRPGNKVLYAEFLSAEDRDTAMVLLRPVVQNVGLWVSPVAAKLPGECSKLKSSSACPRGRTCSDVQKQSVRAAPSVQSISPLLPRVCLQMTAPVDFNSWQELVSAAHSASLKESLSVHAWHATMQLQFGDSWKKLQRECKGKPAASGGASDLPKVEGDWNRELAASENESNVASASASSSSSSLQKQAIPPASLAPLFTEEEDSEDTPDDNWIWDDRLLRHVPVREHKELRTRPYPKRERCINKVKKAVNEAAFHVEVALSKSVSPRNSAEKNAMHKAIAALDAAGSTTSMLARRYAAKAKRMHPNSLSNLKVKPRKQRA
eukprot:TRINITY_DN9519_c0_g1_i1.p1 TRINITY_DN9519_c0_g1~~TRINITY_DN9519_c0_g1_i1.p1  ORF type:complete len:486 (-),score=84.17 TRINITY_DN9519_c0_g1_i1:46-1503(-)